MQSSKNCLEQVGEESQKGRMNFFILSREYRTCFFLHSFVTRPKTTMRAYNIRLKWRHTKRNGNISSKIAKHIMGIKLKKHGLMV